MGGSLALLLPRSVMLIRLLCTRRHLFLSLPLALLQALKLLGSLLVGELFGEEHVVQQRRCLVVDGTVEHHAVVLLVVRVHLRLGEYREAYLILQNRLPTLAAAHGVNTIACRLRHLYQPQLVLHLQQLADDAAALLAVTAVDVVEEERAHRLDAAQLTALRHLTVVVHLYERALVLVLVGLAVEVPVPHVLRGVARPDEVFSVRDGSGDLAPAPVDSD